MIKFKKYNHKIEEKKISDYWIKNKCFKPKITKSKKTFSIVIPPPNITGRLHLRLVALMANVSQLDFFRIDILLDSDCTLNT